MKIVMNTLVSLVLSGLCSASPSLAQTIEPMSLSAKARSNEGVELFAEDGSTPYDTIASWYEKAQSVPYSQVKDTAYEGRCFWLHSKSEPESAALIVRSRTLENNSGPAFPAEIENKVIILLPINTYQNSLTELLSVADKYWHLSEPNL